MDFPASIAICSSMSDRPARIVYARPPSKSVAPYKAQPSTKRLAARVEPLRPALSSTGGIAAFTDLMRQWKLAPARGWRMLTGVSWSAGSLTPDQLARVECLIAIDAGLHSADVGRWMTTGNASPLLCGASPVDYLTKAGTRGYLALAQQVDRWTKM